MTAPTYLQVNPQHASAAPAALAPTGGASAGQQAASSPSGASLVQPTTVTVNPVVYLSIVDHHLRRNTDQDRVIGTLLGVRSDDGTEVEVRSCFPVPHKETGEQVSVDMEYHQNMHELHARVTPNETIVGWYATGSALNGYSALIHDFYQRETTAGGAVHVLVDTGLAADEMPISAFIGSPAGVPAAYQNVAEHEDLQTGLMFVNIPVKHQIADKTGLTMLSAAKNTEERTVGIRSDLENLEFSLRKVKAMIERVATHVHSIVSGKAKGSPQLCKLLMDVLASIPRFDSASFEKAFADHLQDVLMVVHLSNLTRTQLAIAERLQFL